MRIFVTGASGWIGSAVTAELQESGHQVVGLVRSAEGADRVRALGAEPLTGTIDDLDLLAATAAGSDAVIHLAFKHDIAFAGGSFQDAVDADRLAAQAIGEALVGSGKPFSIASGLLGLTPGRVATEADGQTSVPMTALGTDGAWSRLDTALYVRDLSARGVRSSVVRLAPTNHGRGDHGFTASLVATAKRTGMAGYVGDGTNRWSAAHRLDTAHLFCIALESAEAGSTVHAVAEEGVPLGEVAAVIGRHLGLPTASIAPADAEAHFGWLAWPASSDGRASSARTRELLGWQPVQPGLLADLEQGHYFEN